MIFSSVTNDVSFSSFGFFFSKKSHVVYTVTIVGNDFNFGCYAAPVQYYSKVMVTF